MATAAALTIRLELTRAEDAGDPHAFRTGPQDYILRWEGGAFEQARLVWDDALMQDLAALRQPDCDPELVRRVGTRLQRFLEPTRFGGLADAVDDAARAGRSIRLDLVSAAAELYALPWELLTLRDGRHLGEVPQLSIQYHWPGGAAVAPAHEPRPEGGRVLVAYSAAFGNVGESHTIAAIEAAAAAGFVPFARDRDVLPDASLAGLVAWLERRAAEPDPPALLHLLAHGAADDAGAYGLGLHDGRGGRERVDAAALRRALAPFAPHLRLVVLMACDSGNPGPFGARLGGAVQELHRAGFEAVVGSRYPLAGAAALAFTRAFYDALLVQTCSVEQAFLRARVGLARGKGQVWASLTHYGHGGPGHECRPVVFRPHRGLLAFEREHARFFFGRDDERREAIADLEALVEAGKSRFLVVAGASGTGKSSVVLAGIVPALEAKGWTSAVLRPGRAPARALGEALARLPKEARGLLVVDQFEEIFTHAVAGQDPSAFARRLWELSRGEDRHVQVILTLRVDYIGRCGEVLLDDAGLRLDRVAYDEAFRVFVAQMSPDKLAATIEGPVGRVGLSLEPGLARRLLDEIGGDPVGLPLLQYALDELWKRRKDDTLTHAALAEIGGVVGALTRHADAVVDGLAPAEQAQARRLFVRLVAYGAEPSSGTRRRELEAELRPARDPAAFDDAVEALVDARLVVRRLEADGKATLEVAHEALIRNWPRLWRWYEQDRDNLARHRELAEIVAQAAQHKELLSGNLLAATEALIAALGDDADPAARELARTSRAAADRTTRLTRLARLVTFASLVAVLVVVVVSRQKVAQQASRAEVASARNKDGTRLAIAYLQMNERPSVALAMLAEIEHTEIRQYRQAVHLASQAFTPRSFLRLGPAAATTEVTAIAYSPDGAELITGHADGAVRLWPAGEGPADRAVLLLRPGERGARRPIERLSAQPSEGGYRLLAAGPSSLDLWRREGAAAARVALDPPASPDDTYFLGQSGMIARWRPPNAAELADPFEVRRRGGPAREVAPSVTFFAVEGDRLVERRTVENCGWLDPDSERVACNQDFDLRLLAWGSDISLGALNPTPPEPWAFTAEARVFHPPGARDRPVLVDPAGPTIVFYPEGMRAALSERDLFTLACEDTCVLSQIRREPRAVSVDGRLPSACESPSLLGAHPELGALVRCRGALSQLFFLETDPAALPSRLGPGPVLVRHELSPPDDPAAALVLRAADSRLAAAARDGSLWQWDLRDPPAGWLSHVVRAHRSALVRGAPAVLELDVLADNSAELRHVRFDRSGAPPRVDVARVRLPEPQHYPTALSADASGYLATFVGGSDPPMRGPGLPAEPRPGALVWGELPLQNPRLMPHVVGVERVGPAPLPLPPRDPERGRLLRPIQSFRPPGDAEPEPGPQPIGLVGDDRVARQPGGSLAAIPVDDKVALLDLRDPARDLGAVPVTLVRQATSAGVFDVSDALVAAVLHPSGETLALAWASGRALLVRPRSGESTPLPVQESNLCRDFDAARVSALAYAPGGRWLAVGYGSGRLELLPLRDDGAPAGAALVLCRAPQPLSAIAFDPAGEALVTGSLQGGLTIWAHFQQQRGKQLEPIVEWIPGRPAVRDLSVSAERLLVLAADGRIWATHATFDTAALRALIAAKDRPCLTQTERQVLLLEEAEAAEAAEAACSPGHVLQEIAP